MTELAYLPQVNRLALSEDPFLRLRKNLPEKISTRADFLRKLRQISAFSQVFGNVQLRQYQIEAANAIVDSVLQQKGLSIVVMFPRQSGKNMLQAQIEVYLMSLLGTHGAEMVKLSPT